MSTCAVVIEALKITEPPVVKQYKDAHNFRIGKVGLSVANPVRWILDKVLFDFNFKIDTKSSTRTKISVTLSLNIRDGF
jgi:hypothetical protein